MATRITQRPKQKALRNAREAKAEPAKRYVVVHRNEDEAVLQASDTFTNEGEAGGYAERLLRSINFFAGDKLCVEDENGQAQQATNA